ncbi:uncharacterized protein LOC129321364 isoform X2 [Prosopis cineraria]|uniref:uncharacterized protein LOC129321364 isoform X2 n=1 Tax=Prosopis cineraria TaxID=364024 RepID=UPI0024101FFC|nr:uncharacterized protein LOC129321364 isoform X2 [Prosopis cineraria]
MSFLFPCAAPFSLRSRCAVSTFLLIQLTAIGDCVRVMFVRPPPSSSVRAAASMRWKSSSPVLSAAEASFSNLSLSRNFLFGPYSLFCVNGGLWVCVRCCRRFELWSSLPLHHHRSSSASVIGTFIITFSCFNPWQAMVYLASRVLWRC